MKKLLLLCLCLACANLSVFAQTNNGYYGLSLSHQPAGVFLATIAPSGTVSLVGNVSVAEGVMGRTTALNPYQGKFYFQELDGLKILDLNTGSLLQTLPLTVSLPNGSFGNLVFNHSDTTVYGLIGDPTNVPSTNNTSLYLAKLDQNTGFVQQLSTTAIECIGISSNSAIDPLQKFFYFLSDKELIKIDMYDGTATRLTLALTETQGVGNLVYHCDNGQLYGLLGDWTNGINAPTTRLVTIDVQNGNINVISQVSLTDYLSGMSNAVIDAGNYHFIGVDSILTVDIQSGALVSKNAINGIHGHFLLAQAGAACMQASKPERSFAPPVVVKNGLKTIAYPNPVINELNVISDEVITKLELFTISGQLLQSWANDNNFAKLTVEKYPKGTYFLHCYNATDRVVLKIVKY